MKKIFFMCSSSFYLNFLKEIFQILENNNRNLEIRFIHFDSINAPDREINENYQSIKIHDFNCGIKVYKSDVIKSIDVYGDMHRFIPIIAMNKGYNKIDEHIVKHQARKFGKTKFGNERFMRGFLDIITLWFMNKFGKRPMHFFGSMGTIMFIIGIIFTCYIGYEKLFIKTSGRLITERPEFFIALTTIIIGVQLFIAGFLGEIVLNSSSNKKRYHITEKTFD